MYKFEGSANNMKGKPWDNVDIGGAGASTLRSTTRHLSYLATLYLPTQLTCCLVIIERDVCFVLMCGAEYSLNT